MNKIVQLSRRLPLFLLVAVLAVQPSVAGMGHMGRVSTEVPEYLTVLINMLAGVVAPFLA